MRTRVLHWLYLAMLPLLIVLLLGRAWIAAGVVFFVGIPLLWWLRNVSAVLGAVRETRRQSPRYVAHIEAWRLVLQR